MGQRLGIATALLGDPGLLVLRCRPTAWTRRGSCWLRTLVRSLAAEGRGVLISSHLISEMALTADRVVVIGGAGRGGHRRLAAARVAVHELTSRPASLEEAYMELTRAQHPVPARRRRWPAGDRRVTGS